MSNLVGALAALVLIGAVCAQSDPFHRVVYVMRHCVRSTDTTFYGSEPYPNYNNYSAVPFPPWTVPDMLCLPRGLEIIEGQGQNFQGTFPMPLKVISDNVQRDINTSISLLAGLGLSGSVAIQVDGSIFDPVSYGICPNPSEDFTNAALQFRWNQVPVPANHTGMMAALQAKLGQGVAPLLQNILDNVFGGEFNGGSDISSEFAEFLEMQYGGGLDMSWAGVSVDDMYAFTELLSYDGAIYARAFPIVQYTESNLLAHVLNELNDNTTSTTFFVGHDTDLNALATFFNIQWIDAPYATNHTSPGSALRFDLYSQPDQDPTITATYWYTTYENTLGNMTVVNATFADGTNQMAYGDFKSLAEGMLYLPCVNVSSVPAQ